VIRGRAYALAAACCYATLGVFSKRAYEHGTGELELLCARVMGACVLLGALGLALRASLPRGRLLLLSTVGLGLSQLGTTVGLLVGFDRAPAVLVVLLFYVYPVLVSVGASVLYKEEFGVQRLTTLVLGLAGVALTAGRPGSVPVAGVVLGLTAAVSTTAYFLVSRHVIDRGADPLGIASVVYVVPSLVLLVAIAVHGFDFPGAAGSGFSSGVVVIGTVLPILLLFGAIRRIGAALSALLGTLEPFVAVVLAYIFLDERLSGIQLVGGVFIIAAVVVSAMPAPSVLIPRRAPS
jgi:drug/metabolite transporter (DMT)-like permease